MRFLVAVYLGPRFRLDGVDLVPREGPLLVCSNHISTIDPPLIPAELPRADSWSMAKSEYFAPDRRFTRWLFWSYHAFPVVRHTADRRALKRALAVLAAGHVLVVYPEGTRVESGRLQQPEPGVGFIAQRADVPILPVALTGTRDVFPKGAWWPRRKSVRMVVGRPFRVGRTRADGSKISRQEAAEAIMTAIAELLPPENRGEFANLAALEGRLGSVRRPA